MARHGQAQAARMLLAHVALRAPEARIVLIAPPRRWRGTEQLARDVAAAAGGPYGTVSVVEAREVSANRKAAGAESEAARPVSAQETPAQVEDSLTLMCGSGVLDDAATLLSAAAVDGVILACVAGTSTRADLAEARLELERAGARLLGAVLVG